MDIRKKLSNELLNQEFIQENCSDTRLNQFRQIAAGYATTENVIAVLSDMQANTSYLYYGGIAETLGMGKRGDSKILHSIWEEEIFARIHPDDLLDKHLQELRFFQFLKGLPEGKRTDYYIDSRIRMRNAQGTYVWVRHRMYYVATHANGNVWLALCLYGFSPDSSFNCMVINSVDGTMTEWDKETCKGLLSKREKEILLLIEEGKSSKEIAETLSISVNTVNRHRQNILEKLQVDNLMQACRTARELKLLFLDR